MSDDTALTAAESESQAKHTQTSEHSKNPIAFSPKVTDVQRITQQYLKALSQIEEVELAFYRPRQGCIKFVVVVTERVHRKLSQQLARIEGQLYDDHPD